MDKNTYCRCQAMEQRIDHGRECIERDYPQDDYRRAAALAGYNTAVDCITCYRQVGGDIWISPQQPPEDDRNVLVLTSYGGVSIHVVGWYDDGEWRTLDANVDDNVIQTVRAWCELPEEPEDL